MRTEEEIAEKFKIGRSSAKLYLRNYEKMTKKLTDDEMKDADKIINTFDKLKPNTLRTYILSVMRVLELDEEDSSIVRISSLSPTLRTTFPLNIALTMAP